MQVHRHIDGRLCGKKDRQASRTETGERIVIAHGTDQHADDNEGEYRHQRETESDPEFLRRDRKHKIGMALRKNALNGALARPFAEPAAAHEAFSGNVDVESVAGARIEEALNAASNVGH